MVFSITYTDRRRGRVGDELGMTLPELIVSVGISSLIALGMSGLMFYSSRSLAALANYADLDHRSRVTLDIMSRDIRQAKRLADHTETKLTFEDYDGGTLSFVYDPQGRTLTKVKNGVAESKPLLTECIQLKFSIYQRNPIGGTYNQYAAASPTTCKLVQLQWTCSRKIFGVEKNTESVQSAKVVIRKQ